MLFLVYKFNVVRFVIFSFCCFNGLDLNRYIVKYYHGNIYRGCVGGRKNMMSVADRLLQIIRGRMLIWFVIFFLLSFTVCVNAVTITTSTKFLVGNETYTVSKTMKFHTITIDDSYIIFNTTGFYVTSGNAITVTLSYINSNIVGAGDGVKVLEFSASTTGGSVSFGLSGFQSGNKYDVKRNGTTIASVTADGSGLISFSNSAWSTRLFSIYRNGSAPTDVTPPVISSVSLAHSSVLDTSIGWENISCTVTDNVAVQNVFLRVVKPGGALTNSSMSLKAGSSTYYLNTTFGVHGNYSYSIWAVDTSGNGVSSSSSVFSLPPNWDVNNDGSCTVFDYVLISNKYGQTGSNGWIREDVDNNGQIQVFDMVLLSNYYGSCWWV